MPAGRPTKYKETYCDQVIEEMAEGKSLTAFAAEIGVCRDTITEWCSKHAEFSLAVKKGKAKCAAWWEARQRKTAETGEGNATSVIFGLKNMAPDDWREKTEVAQTVDAKHEHSGEIGLSGTASFIAEALAAGTAAAHQEPSES